jgi:outer membrane immunogenic protein
MKKSLLGLVAMGALIAGPAMAADMQMPLKAPPAPAPAPVATWTGCYVGGNVGGAWTNQNQNRVDQLTLAGTIVPAPAPYGSDSETSVAGGAQVGCDYQFYTNWVIGVQGMFDWTDLSGSHASGVIGPGIASFTMNDRTKNFDTATARLGYAFAGSALAYIKGGAAWVHNKDTLFGLTTGGVSFLSESASWTATGWTIGGGIEYRFMPNWSVFAEYDYMDFGTQTIMFNAPPGLTSLGEHIAIQQNVQQAVVGVNWRFNWGGAIATRY